MRKRGNICDKRSQKRCTIPEVRDANDEIDPTRFFCVGCMEPHEVEEGNRHHVLEHAEGGLSEHWNVLMLCQSCHLVFHNGTKKDQRRVFHRAFAYMTSLYGMLFMLQHKTYYESLKADLKTQPMTLAQFRRANEAMKQCMDMELAHSIAPGVARFGPGDEPYRSVFPE